MDIADYELTKPQKVKLEKYRHGTQEINLCAKCGGKGKIYWDELVNHHKGDYEIRSETCSECKGSGRTKTITFCSSITEPFKPKK